MHDNGAGAVPPPPGTAAGHDPADGRNLVARSATHASPAPPAEPGRAQAARRSQAIAIARVVCILGVVYVHAWTGLAGHNLELARGTPQENLRWFLMETFGRSAVPLLGLISGWLVAGSRQLGDWRGHVARKARTILVPMIAWNVIAVTLVSGTAWLFDLPAPVPSSPGWLAEEIFILTRNPDIDVQMPFLRDLFVCMLAAPLLARAPGRVLLAVALAAGIAQVFGLGWPVLLRPSILLFFALGMWCRRNGMAERVVGWPLALAAGPFLVLLPFKLWVAIGLPEAAGTPLAVTLDLVVRVLASLAFWRLSWALAGSRLRDRILAVEPYAFFLFCMHLVLIWLLGPIGGRLTGKLGAPLYPVYLLAQPFLALASAMLLGQLLLRVAPRAARLLSGGRLGPGASSRTAL